MASDGVWIFVDDRTDEAAVFAEELSASGLVKVEVMGPGQARSVLLQERREPAGVLMDVDLSTIVGEFGTGPGIAQDIRTKQKAGLASEFPVVRFSAAEPVIRNVLGDPSSDDLFELAILKDDLKIYRDEFATQLVGVRRVYDFFTDRTADWGRVEERLTALFGIDSVKMSTWTHMGLRAKILTGVAHAPHVAAGAYCRLFLMPAGLLIDRELLAIRLGVDIASSGEAWHQLLDSLKETAYKGVGGVQFERWWARGVEDWWYTVIDSSGPISGTTAVERVDLIKKVLSLTGLRAVEASAGQTETKFWRFCRLGLEKRPTERIPVDPSDSVRLISQDNLPNWVEPLCVSARLAFRNKDDPRLNQKDLDRLRRKYKV